MIPSPSVLHNVPLTILLGYAAYAKQNWPRLAPGERVLLLFSGAVQVSVWMTLSEAHPLAGALALSILLYLGTVVALNRRRRA